MILYKCEIFSFFIGLKFLSKVETIFHFAFEFGYAGRI